MRLAMTQTTRELIVFAGQAKSIQTCRGPQTADTISTCSR